MSFQVLGRRSFLDMYHIRGPDYDELLIRLSLYVFHQLSLTDQQQQIQQIRGNAEEQQEAGDADSTPKTFSELFRKLPYSDQVNFLFKLVQKFKPHEKRPVAEKSEDNDEQEETRDGKPCFAEFFLGFSKIWFQGQSARGQQRLIEQLSSDGVKAGGRIKRLQEETEEEFKLRRFTELCLQEVIDFRVQQKFLDEAKVKLEEWGMDAYYRLIGEETSFDTTAEVLCCFFRRLCPKDEEELIDKIISVLIELKMEKLLCESEENWRLRRFENMCCAATVYAADFLFDVSMTWFKSQCMGYRRNPIQVMLFGAKEVEFVDVIEILPDESEEEFRLRRFTESFNRLDFTSRVRFVYYILGSITDPLPPRRTPCPLRITKMAHHPIRLPPRRARFRLRITKKVHHPIPDLLPPRHIGKSAHHRISDILPPMHSPLQIRNTVHRPHLVKIKLPKTKDEAPPLVSTSP